MAKTEEYPEDFRFLVRLINTDLDGKKNVANALTGLKGVNHRMSRIIASKAGVDRRARMGELSDEQIAALSETLEVLDDFTPAWMRNRRNDPDTGDDIHLVGTEHALVLREDLNRLKKIRSWRGVRHDQNLPVRGQRTRANGRTGATVGVQRKK